MNQANDKPVAPNNEEHPDCAGLRDRMAAATATYERHRSYFTNERGQYYEYQSMLRSYDHAAMLNTGLGFLTSVRAGYLMSQPTQLTRQVGLVGESFRDVGLASRGASRLASGLGIVGIGADVAYLANYATDGDGANALLSVENIGYGSAGLILGGPIGITFGAAQLVVNGSLYQYQREQDKIDRQNLTQSANSSIDAMATAERVGADIAAKMAELKCK